MLCRKVSVSLLVLVGFALPIVGLLTGCNGNSGSSSAKTKRIILLTNGDDPFWDAMRVGMEKAAEDFDLASVNLRVEMDKNDGTAKGQLDKLKQYAGQTDIAGLAISSTDADNSQLAKAMKQLTELGVKVITIDSDMNREKFADSRFAYLGTDNVIGGQELGKAAKGLRPDGGTYAAFYGLSAAANVIERTSGFQQGAGESFKKADGLADDMDPTKAENNVRIALQNHPGIDTLVGIWAYNAPAIVEVVKEQNIRETTTIVVFDADQKAIKHLDEGFVDAMVVQNPYQMGYVGTKLMKALIQEDDAIIKEMFPNKGEDGGDIFTTELRVVVPDENSPLTADMFNEDTEFFKFSEFKTWLDERGLTGS